MQSLKICKLKNIQELYEFFMKFQLLKKNPPPQKKNPHTNKLTFGM